MLKYGRRVKVSCHVNRGGRWLPAEIRREGLGRCGLRDINANKPMKVSCRIVRLTASVLLARARRYCLYLYSLLLLCGTDAASCACRLRRLGFWIPQTCPSGLIRQMTISFAIAEHQSRLTMIASSSSSSIGGRLEYRSGRSKMSS